MHSKSEMENRLTESSRIWDNSVDYLFFDEKKIVMGGVRLALSIFIIARVIQ